MDLVRPGWKHGDVDDHDMIRVVSSHQWPQPDRRDRHIKTERHGKPRQQEAAGEGGKDSENEGETDTKSAGAWGRFCAGYQAPRN